MRITRHFATVGSRRVHYLRAGSGPALVLLHASACSAKVMRPLIARFAEGFTVLAPDSPGFGLSDRLPVEQPSVEDLADGVRDWLDVLGVTHTAIYGRHTGASIAVEFAARHPGRTAMALADGYPILTADFPEERLAAYLQPIRPTWDGGHLVWLWFRYRDQHSFWPWNAQDLAHRADTDIPDLDFLHRGVVEFLEAGNDYRLGYRAPFRHDALGAFGRLRVPVCFGTRPGDWLHQNAALYPAGTWHEVMDRDAARAAGQEYAILRRHPADATVPPAPACAALPGRTVTDYVDLGDASLLVRSSGEGRGRPLVVLPHVPGSSRLYDDLVLALGNRRPVLAFDYPGHGESDPLPGNPQSVAAWAEAVGRALVRLGATDVDLYGHNAGAAVALELAAAASVRVGRMVLDAPIAAPAEQRAVEAERWSPDVTPAWDGGHLLRAWHHARDQELWWPWYDRRLAAIRGHEPRIDPDALTLRVREAIKQPANYQAAWRAAWLYPVREKLAAAAVPAALLCAGADGFAPLLPYAVAARPDATVLGVADDAAARAAAIGGFLAGG
jgi:pimeloyl-ACP methyl ester carboxylesterase